MFSRSLLIAVLCTVVAVSFAEHQRLHGLKAAEHHRSRHHGLNKLNRERSAYQHTICNILCSGNNTVTTGPPSTGSPTPAPIDPTPAPIDPTPAPIDPTPKPPGTTTPEPTTTVSPTPEPIDPTPAPIDPSTPPTVTPTEPTGKSPTYPTSPNTTETSPTTTVNPSDNCIGINVCFSRRLSTLFAIIGNFYPKDASKLILIISESLNDNSSNETNQDLYMAIRVLFGFSSKYDLRVAASVYITNIRKLIGKGSIKIDAGLYAVLTGKIGFSGLFGNFKGKSAKLEADAASALILASILSIRITVTGESYSDISGKLGVEFSVIVKISEQLGVISGGQVNNVSIFDELKGCLPTFDLPTFPNLTTVEDRSHGVAHHLVKEHGHHANKAHHLVKEHGHHANKAHHLVKEHGHHANKAHHLVKEHGHHANKAHHEVKEHHGHHANKAHHEVKEHHGHHANKAHHEVKEHHGHHANKAHHEVKEHHGHHANKAHHDHHANKAHHQVKEHHDHHANKAHHQVKEHHGNNAHHANKAHSTNHHENKHHHANKEHHHHGSNQ